MVVCGRHGGLRGRRRGRGLRRPHRLLRRHRRRLLRLRRLVLHHRGLRRRNCLLRHRGLLLLLLQQLLVLLHLGVELRRLERLLGELLDAGHDGRLDLRRRHHGHRCRALLRLKDLRLLHLNKGEHAAMPALGVPRPRWNLCEDWVGPLTHRARRSTGV